MHSVDIDEPDPTNTASGAAQSDTVDQSNGAQFTQNLEAVNDCDEENTGDSLQTAVMTLRLMILTL